MASTILQLAQDAFDDAALSLERPSTLFAAYDEGDTSDRRFLRAITRTCRAIAARYPWQAVMAEHSFQTVSAEVQPSAIPSDLLRAVPDTMWVSGLQFYGPVSDSDWAAMRAGRLPQGWPSFRIYNDEMHLWPAPGVGQTVRYSYIRNSIGTTPPVSPATARTAVARFQTDADTTYWDDELIILGCIFELRKSMRLDYAQDQMDFERAFADRIKGDGGSKILSMRPSSRNLRKPAVTLISNDGSRWGGSDR